MHFTIQLPKQCSRNASYTISDPDVSKVIQQYANQDWANLAVSLKKKR